MTTKHIPEIYHSPIGSSYRALTGGMLGELERCGREIDGIGITRLGPRNVIIVNSAFYLHQVLVEKAAAFHKGPLLRLYLGHFLGNGILTSEADFHRRQRKMMAPAFMPRRIATYADVMVEETLRAETRWSDGNVVNVAKEMMRLTLGIVGKTLFGADVLGESEDLGNALTVAMHQMIRLSRSPIRIPVTWKTPGNVGMNRANARIDETVYRFIEERRRSGCYTDDLLSMLLLAQDEDNGAVMTDKQVRDEAMTLFIAGHETTANALTWAWQLLSENLESYRKMIEEVDTELCGRPATVADLPRLAYTLRVFKETIRLYPPAYMFGRTVVEDVTLGEYEVKKGAVVIVSPYMVHRNPKMFADPNRFDPDRFLPEAEKTLPRYAYMPFGNGPRICIGNHFSLMEGHLILATLAQRVRFERIPGSKAIPDPLITLRPKGALNLKVIRRVDPNTLDHRIAGRHHPTDNPASPNF